MKILSGLNNKILKKLLVCAVLFLFLFSAFLFLRKEGLPDGHDIFAHVTYVKLFENSLTEGQIPVRWTEGIKEGLSQPLFNYYQVGFYYLTSFFTTLGFDLVLSIKLSILSLWGVGTFFIYLLAKKWGTIPSLLASVVYFFSPYLLLDIFIRASYPEFMAISFLPGVFWAIEKTLSQAKIIYIIPLALFLGLAFISHLPTMVIYTPLLSLFVLLNILQKNFTLKGVAYTLLGSVLGVGIASFYIIPAILELDLIQIQLLRTNDFDFHTHFAKSDKLFTYIWGYSGEFFGSDKKLLSFLGVFQWTIFAISTLPIILLRISWKVKATLLFWVIVLLYAYFFSFPVSLSIWENIKFIQFLQFPWRFFMVIPITTAILSAILLSLFKQRKIQIIFLFLIACLNMYFYMPFLNDDNFIIKGYFNQESSIWKEDSEAKIDAYYEPGYNPIDAREINREMVPAWEIPQGEAEVEELVNLDHEKLYRINSKEEVNFILNTHYFLIWKAYLNNQEVRIDTTDKYFMSLKVPSGDHLIKFEFKNTSIRSVSNILTVFSGLILICLIFFNLIQKYFKKN